MKIETLLEEIQSHEEIIAVHREKLSEKQRVAANRLCPFVVGERVLNGQGEQEIIHRIMWSGMPNRYNNGYAFTIKKIKKNGEPYKDYSHAYNQTSYTKYNG